MKLQMNTAIVRMVQGMFSALIITHIFACFWFLSSKLYEFTPETWVYRLGILDEPTHIQYLYSFYWSTQTIVTVGYGDIPAVTSVEKLLSLFWMMFGVGFYSFIIGNYTSIIANNMQMQTSLLLKVKSLAELAKKADIPLDLLTKIKKFFEENYGAIYNQEEEGGLIKILPPSLRDEVMINTFGEII